jgi:uncharacterized lipoprotein YddW (UPF0748 family)
MRISRPLLLCVLAFVAACAPDRPQPLVPDAPPAEAAIAAVSEARALWVTRFEYDSPTKIATIMARAKSANFNVVYFQVRGAADAMYRSSIEPCAVSLCGRLGGTPTWDPLAVAVTEAHSRGLQLHAWVNALTAWGSGSSTSCSALVESAPGNPRHLLLDRPSWKVKNAAGTFHPCPNGEEYVYFSPGNKGVRTRLARVSADIVRRYAVDGIHLDRIRYPGTAWSYDSASLRLFGKDPAAYPSDWNNFRRTLVDSTVKAVRDSINRVRPAAVLSAAIWPIYVDKWGWNSSEGYHQYFQHTYPWVRDGYMDVHVPMTYYSIHATYCGFADWACLLDDHLQRTQTWAGKHLYIGIDGGKGAAEVNRQIALARQKGAKGVSFYSYSRLESAGLWSTLASGAFATPATVPAMTWK